jgi:hypothetical protein
MTSSPYPTETWNRHRRRMHQARDFLRARGELRFMAPHFDPAEAIPVTEEAVGGELLPLIARFFPWLGAAALAWVLYEMLNRVSLGDGNATATHPPGFSLETYCHNTGPGYDSYSTSSTHVASWVTSVNNCSRNFTAGSNPSILANIVHLLGLKFQAATNYTFASTWTRPIGAVTQPIPAIQALQNLPLRRGKTYPLGDPGATPDSFPSLFPLLAPLFQPGVPDAVPFQTIPEFDRAAEQEWTPWIQREVGPGEGPAPWNVPDVGHPWRSPLPPWWQRPPARSPDVDAPPWTQPAPVTPPAPWWPPQADPSEPPPVAYPPIYPVTAPTSPHDPAVDRPPSPSGQLSPKGPTFDGSDIDYMPPPAGQRERKLKATPRGLIHLLALATYAGGFTRDLWMSLPKQCRSKSRTGKVRYSTMVSDIYKCIDKVNWDQFQNRAAWTIAKYGLEGAAIRQINNASRTAGFGMGTTFLHGQPPAFSHGAGVPPSDSGGAFSNRQWPFQPADDFAHWVAAKLQGM